MKYVEQINSTPEAWKKFLATQPELHPELFKTPYLDHAMTYFKEMLECIYQRAILRKSISGFYSFIQAVNSDQAQGQMLTWLDTYSPIRQIKTKNGTIQHEVIRDFIHKCSWIDAKTNPYYKIKVRPRKIIKIKQHLPFESNFDLSKKQDAEVSNIELDAKILFNTSSPAKSDFDFSIKMAKNAFNEFIKERSVESKHKLFERINAIPVDEIRKKGQPFLQGGAPGLGK